MTFFANLGNDLRPVGEIAHRYADKYNDLDESTLGLTQISRRPKVGTEAYAISLFHGVDPDTISKYEEIHSFSIPEHYRRILEKLNGAYVFEFHLYGIPPSMAQNPPLLDRSRIQPLDLATANQYWQYPYNAPEGSFHFGSGPWSLKEHVGYFSTTKGIAAIRKGGECIASWVSLERFLEDEIERSEGVYGEYEEFLAATFNKSK